MDSDDDVPDTRVFVSGLPPNYTSEQLGAHFAGRYQVTDAVVIPGRQIGFVGFRNYTLAKSAVKYFDKSYIRLSKISVSLAKPVELSRGGQAQAAPVSQSGSQAGVGGSQASNDANSQPPFTPYVPLTRPASANKRKRDAFSSLDDVALTKQPRLGAEPGQKDNNGDFNREETETRTKSEKSSKKKKEERTKLTEGKRSTSLTSDHERSVHADVDELLKKEKKGKKKTTEADSTGARAVPGSQEISARESKKQRKEEKKRRRKEVQEDEPGQTAVSDEGMESISSGKKHSEKQKYKSLEAISKTKGGVDTVDGVDFNPGSDEADLSQQNEERNDSDWLRARTSRTLDLVNENELEDIIQGGMKPDDILSSDMKAINGTHQVNLPAAESLNEIQAHDKVANGRLFVRNLSYTATEEELTTLFAKHGKVEEIHLVKDFKTSASKGMAYIQFAEPEAARRAMQKLDGKSFQGRLLHILPASDKKRKELDDFQLSKLPLKKQKALKRKAEASKSSFNWNSLYMNPDAILASIAADLGVRKADILDPTSSDAAVKQALAETEVIKKTKDSLRQNGVNIDAFQNRVRDDRTILIKNFPFETTSEEIRNILSPFGQISKFVFPSTGTMAIALFEEAHDAQQALRQLSYRNIRGSILYLEKGPAGLFQSSKGSLANPAPDLETSGGVEPAELKPYPEDLPSSTLFVRNLSFETTTPRLSDVFRPIEGFKSAKVKTRIDPKRPGEILSMGFGFVEFQTKAQANAALQAMNGYQLDGHKLQIQMSQKPTDLAEERRHEDKSKNSRLKKAKIVIKNLPFETSKKDVRKLFSAYGQLRTVRVPQKFDHSTRGFAFAEFVTPKEAENAMNALQNTHLLGRRLVLEYAEGDDVDPEEEIRAIEKKLGQQTSMMRLNQLTGGGRRKFNVDARDEDMEI